MGLESNLKKLGVDIKKDYAKILSGTNILRLSNNPIELKKSDLKFILLKTIRYEKRKFFFSNFSNQILIS